MDCSGRGSSPRRCRESDIANATDRGYAWGMDSETKIAFSTVESRFDQVETLLVGLTEGQVRTNATMGTLTDRVDKLTEQVTRTATIVNALAEGQDVLRDGLLQLTEQVTRTATIVNALAEGQMKLGERVDGFTAAVLRGFTEGAGRDLANERRVDALEARMTKLEQQ